MNANRLIILGSIVLFLVSFIAVSDCRAEGESLPAMSGINDLLVQYSRLGNAKASEECGIANGEMDASFLKSLKSYGVPAVSTVEASPKTDNLPRIEILPEVVTAKNSGNDCTSWIAVTAQSQNSLRIPPIPTPRNILIVYWHGGMIVNSGRTGHAQAVNEALDKISNIFSRQYKNDQPPVL